MTAPVNTLPKLRPEIKQKWLDALRSGDYRQGVSLLAYEETPGEKRYCCLGVLCDIAAREGVVQPEPREPVGPDVDDEAGREADNHDYVNVVRFVADADDDHDDTEFAVTMPGRVLVNWAYQDLVAGTAPEWYVLWPTESQEDGELDSDYVRRESLAELNDDHGLTFDQIADLIEMSL